MVFPSGEKRAKISFPTPEVNFLAVPPDLATVYRSPEYENTIASAETVGNLRRRASFWPVRKVHMQLKTINERDLYMDYWIEVDKCTGL